MDTVEQYRKTSVPEAMRSTIPLYLVHAMIDYHAQLPEPESFVWTEENFRVWLNTVYNPDMAEIERELAEE